MRKHNGGIITIAGLAILLGVTSCAPEAYHDEVIVIVIDDPRPPRQPPRRLHPPCPAPLPDPVVYTPIVADPSPEPGRYAALDRKREDAVTETRTREIQTPAITEVPRPKPPREAPANDRAGAPRDETTRQPRTR